jgi:hypothetical protein
MNMLPFQPEQAVGVMRQAPWFRRIAITGVTRKADQFGTDKRIG